MGRSRLVITLNCFHLERLIATFSKYGSERWLVHVQPHVYEHARDVLSACVHGCVQGVGVVYPLVPHQQFRQHLVPVLHRVLQGRVTPGVLEGQRGQRVIHYALNRLDVA